jgi:superfamily II DNA or RNA helicase
MDKVDYFLKSIDLLQEINDVNSLVKLCYHLRYDNNSKDIYNAIIDKANGKNGEKYHDYINLIDTYAGEKIRNEDTIDYPTCANNNAHFMGKVKPYQERAVRALQKRRGLLLIYGTGSGKTLCAILASQCFLSNNNKNGRVIVLSPNESIKENFTKELNEYGVSSVPYIISTYRSASNIKMDKNSTYFLVLDEAHTVNNFATQDFFNAFQLSKQSKKVLLLSATPIVNDVTEIIPLMALIDPEIATTFFVEKNKKMELRPDIKKDFNDLKRETDLPKIINQLSSWLLPFNCNISIYRVSKKDLEEYPTAKIIDNFFIMTPSQLEEYKEEETKDDAKGENVDSFRVDTRQISNTLGTDSPVKIQYIQKIVNSPHKKIVIYSSWQDKGIKLIESALPSNSFVKITGDENSSKRKEAKEAFNNGDKNILLITSAGSEGIDLKCTTDIIIMEPYFNDSVTQQVMGRGIRYKSHSKNCYNDNKQVTVHNLYLIKETDIGCVKNLGSCDRYRERNGEVKISTDLFLKLTSIGKQKIIDGFIDSLGVKDSIETHQCGLELPWEKLTISTRQEYPKTIQIWVQNPLIKLMPSNNIVPLRNIPILQPIAGLIPQKRKEIISIDDDDEVPDRKHQQIPLDGKWRILTLALASHVLKENIHIKIFDSGYDTKLIGFVDTPIASYNYIKNRPDIWYDSSTPNHPYLLVNYKSKKNNIYNTLQIVDGKYTDNDSQYYLYFKRVATKDEETIPETNVVSYTLPTHNYKNIPKGLENTYELPKTFK